MIQFFASARACKGHTSMLHTEHCHTEATIFITYRGGYFISSVPPAKLGIFSIVFVWCVFVCVHLHVYLKDLELLDLSSLQILTVSYCSLDTRDGLYGRRVVVWLIRPCRVPCHHVITLQVRPWPPAQHGWMDWAAWPTWSLQLPQAIRWTKWATWSAYSDLGRFGNSYFYHSLVLTSNQIKSTRL